jgi:hypothetical protein
MKKNMLMLLFVITNQILSAQNVGIGTTTPNSSAQLDVSSSTKGMLVPRMTTAQRTAIALPASGLLVFDNNTGSFWFKSNTNWVELLDSSNNNWKQNGENSFVGNNAKVGIRTNSPQKPLDVRTHDSIAGHGIRIHNLSATEGSKSSLLLSSNTSGSSNGGFAAVSAVQGGGAQSQHLVFSTAANLFAPSIERMRIDSAGNVNIIASANIGGSFGVGLTNPDVKLHVINGTDVGNASGGFIQLGPTAASNIAIDNNEIMARTNGLAAKLTVQANGGEFQTGAGAAQYSFTTNGELNRTNVTGNNNLLPLCYGKVRDNGTIAGGSGNFTVVKHPTSAGRYYISINGETNMGANADQYMIIASPSSPGILGIEASNDVYVVNSILQGGTYDNTIAIRTKKFTIDYINNSVVADCNVLDCQYKIASYFTNSPGPREVDGGFTFIVYKL